MGVAAASNFIPANTPANTTITDKSFMAVTDSVLLRLTFELAAVAWSATR